MTAPIHERSTQQLIYETVLAGGKAALFGYGAYLSLGEKQAFENVRAIAAGQYVVTHEPFSLFPDMPPVNVPKGIHTQRGMLPVHRLVVGGSCFVRCAENTVECAAKTAVLGCRGISEVAQFFRG